MNHMKKAIAVLLAVMLMIPAMAANAATASPAKKSIAKVDYMKAVTKVYNKKNQKPKLTVKIGKNTLKEGRDYVIVEQKWVNAGKYVVKIKGIGAFRGTKRTYYTIKQASQKLTTKKIKSFKANALKKKSHTFTLGARTSGTGKLTYSTAGTRKSLRKYIKITKNGTITFKKGTKKGSYKVTIYAKANKNYKAAKKTVVFKVK